MATIRMRFIRVFSQIARSLNEEAGEWLRDQSCARMPDAIKTSISATIAVRASLSDRRSTRRLGGCGGSLPSGAMEQRLSRRTIEHADPVARFGENPAPGLERRERARMIGPGARGRIADKPAFPVFGFGRRRLGRALDSGVQQGVDQRSAPR
jgi:hypothetical protein